VGERSTGLESERLARQYFELFNARSIGRLAELIHPDVVLELQAVDVGRVLRGRPELVRFFAEQFARRRWDAYLQAVHALDECKVIVEGRVRWIDDERVLRDSPRVWALEFCDGLLLRSIPARSVDDAHAILYGRGCWFPEAIRLPAAHARTVRGALKPTVAACRVNRPGRRFESA
jgi:SnoaL-like domain